MLCNVLSCQCIHDLFFFLSKPCHHAHTNPPSHFRCTVLSYLLCILFQAFNHVQVYMDIPKLSGALTNLPELLLKQMYALFESCVFILCETEKESIYLPVSILTKKKHYLIINTFL